MPSVTMTPLQKVAYVASATTTTPPAGAVTDAYIVPVGAAGDWAGHEGDIAIPDWAGGWIYTTPEDGHKVIIGDSDTFAVFRAGAWKSIGPDHDWHRIGSTDAPDDIADGIETQGRVIVRDGAGVSILDINASTGNAFSARGNVFRRGADGKNLFSQYMPASGKDVVCDVLDSNISVQKRWRLFPDGKQIEYHQKNMFGLVPVIENEPGILPEKRIYGTRVYQTTNRIYVDAIAGDDVNPGDASSRPVQTFGAALDRLVSDRTNYILFLSDVTIDTNQVFSVQNGCISISLLGSDGVGGFTRRELTLTGGGRLLSGYGFMIMRCHEVTITEQAGRVANSVFYSTANISFIMTSSSHVGAFSPLLLSGTTCMSYFSGAALTPGLIFNGIAAGAQLDWRYSNSNLTTG